MLCKIIWNVHHQARPQVLRFGWLSGLLLSCVPTNHQRATLLRSCSRYHVQHVPKVSEQRRGTYVYWIERRSDLMRTYRTGLSGTTCVREVG
ncbi:MAG: hypothetical protein AVDCRST_MAG93-8023 [uncultured Chloroflexia bacterium]|uniref:Uncharacterized protein n=1 Tax=uncultured Chloroflexia bacterium TaxID=1672391 RepID=A0A6J4MU31_9CHLR|nr:MAG: hypothetical protein AVDCRST_MAG93-8023 [uncultured Chloroflexia bacterium]